MTTACSEEAARVSRALDRAQLDAAAALAAGAVPGVDPAPAPFAGWERVDGPCSTGWRQEGDGLRLAVGAPEACFEMTAPDSWTAGLLRVGDKVELVTVSGAAGSPSAPPVVTLPPPFADRGARPRAEPWSAALDGYRGRIVMIVSEASFFACLLFVMIALLWKTLRREVELERQHRNFLSAITHELKSPLAAMRLSLETVLRGRADSTASVRFLENALQDTERLQSLVQKVLEVTRYGRGVGTLRLRRVNLSDTIHEVLATFARRATASGASVDPCVESDIWALADEEALTIVISNLLENGVKYGGTVPRLAVALRLENDRAVIEVGDNGRGIPPEEVPFIFDRFYRGGDEMTRTTQGTGLGLYLVRQIVHAHQGSVTVAATGTRGTTFRVSLPGAEVVEESP